ncbi:putative pyrimidine monooxygenase RutA-2 [Coleophoma crateriformis]|uniref:Putative pyrimidine monooxygenase RutA-2 n=1 Tax=Coleophoma crateriformis TaxID=565419 RepID=A0A3D8RQ99_9HELO|nr:putative pyrimidine monooxygenase RutA-2 [Coleophoma crateriformis]
MTEKHCQIGVFIPIGNNGFLISSNTPQYKPTFELNRDIVLLAEKYGFEFALSMVKLRGFGGETEYWDYNLESFTLMAGIAAVTSKINLIASTPILVLPPAIVARMATTIDSIAPGRFGINIVTGWQAAEYEQMGLWPGDKYFGYRYEYATEYVQVLRDLMDTGVSNFKGKHFTMNDCKMLPKPSARVEIVAAGQSPPGVKFATEHADYNFIMARGQNNPTGIRAINDGLVEAAKKADRDVGALVLYTIIAEETDEAALAKWKFYNDGADDEAIAWATGQASRNVNLDQNSSAKRELLGENRINNDMNTMIGSYERVAGLLDELANEPIKGIMLIFDDFMKGIEVFGTKVQPLMKTRVKTVAALASQSSTS